MLLGLGRAHHGAHEVDTLRDLRDRSRLAQLLMARRHAPEALKELERIDLTHAPVTNEAWDRAMGDPSIRWLKARALEEVGRREEAEPLVADPSQVLSSYGPWWAMRGRWARDRGDESMAESSFREAVAADPFDPEGACECLDPLATDPSATSGSLSASPSASQPAAVSTPLCAAARQAGEPPFDAD
jgi:hypothetical protein